MTAQSISLREVTDENRDAVCALIVGPGQQRFVSSVAESLDEAAATPEAAPWYRAIYADEESVGFVNARTGFEPTGEIDEGEIVLRLDLSGDGIG
jgi:diamine N-acetyltransferase